jgi:transposase
MAFRDPVQRPASGSTCRSSCSGAPPAAPTAAPRCPSTGARLSYAGARPAERLTWLVWRKHRIRCIECRRTLTETHEQLPSRQRVRVCLRARQAERVAGGAAHAEVAREEGATRYQVARAFAGLARGLEHGAQRRPRRLPLEEAHHRRDQGLATVVADLDCRRVVQVLDGRDGRTVERWLSPLPDKIRHRVDVVSIDPSDAYRQAIRAALPHARIVCDHFQLVCGVGRGAARAPARRAVRRPKGVRAAGSTTPGGPSSTAPQLSPQSPRMPE